MAERRSHYERAFERYLRDRGASHVFLNDAKRVVVDEGARLRPPALTEHENTELAERGVSLGGVRTLKSFDLVLYSDSVHAIVDVKGRKVSAKLGGPRTPRLENWVTEDDIDSLIVWETLFGEGYEAAFVFVYWCESRPPMGLFDDAFEHHGRWYGLRGAVLSEYRGVMKPRSARWRTVHVDQGTFEEISRPVFGRGELYSHAAAS